MFNVTRLCNYRKFLVTKFLIKVAQIISDFLGCFEKPHSYVKIAVGTSKETFWLLFTPTSGHTVNV